MDHEITSSGRCRGSGALPNVVVGAGTAAYFVDMWGGHGSPMTHRGHVAVIRFPRDSLIRLHRTRFVFGAARDEGLVHRPNHRRLLIQLVALSTAAGMFAVTAAAVSADGDLANAQVTSRAEGSAGRRPGPILPDLTPLRATDLSVAVEGGVRKLRFQAGLANIGRGPMEVRPNNVKPCRGGKRHASQIIYRDADDNGYFKRAVDTPYTRKSSGCMVFHPAHNHWHFQAASRYRLFKPGHADSILVRARKMSFCLRDSMRVPTAYGRFYQPLYYADCGRDTPQGISSGWVDVYASYLSGQALTLPKRLRHGIYCLGIRVDPLDRLWESDEGNNTSVKAFRLRRTSVLPVAHNRVCQQ
jgi:hypothetical protein